MEEIRDTLGMAFLRVRAAHGKSVLWTAYMHSNVGRDIIGVQSYPFSPNYPEHDASWYPCVFPPNPGDRPIKVHRIRGLLENDLHDHT